MRSLIANPLWWAHVAACNCDEDSNLDIENVLAIAAYSVTDFDTACVIAEHVAEATLRDMSECDDPQELLIRLLTNVIARVN